MESKIAVCALQAFLFILIVLNPNATTTTDKKPNETLFGRTITAWHIKASLYPVIAMNTLAGILYTVVYIPSPWSIGEIIAACTCLTGCIVRLWAYATLGHLFTFELAIRKGHKLVTTGPYVFARHPSYTAFGLAFIGRIA
jgi:protein-S-isoprenylcysteine O-methyltransferase Ste14